MYGLEALLVGPRFNLEVEARIVDTHYHIGMEVEDVLLAKTYVVQYGA